jgi:hypothetical protein
MIRVKVLIVGETLLRDVDSNKYSLINILDNIRANGFPLVIPHVVFLAIFERDQDDVQKFEATLTLFQNNHEILKAKLSPDFQNCRTNRSCWRLNGIVVTGPGELRFHLSADEGLDADYFLPIQGPEVPKVYPEPEQNQLLSSGS